jgi:hypothetical protein
MAKNFPRRYMIEKKHDRRAGLTDLPYETGKRASHSPELELHASSPIT